VPGRPLSRPRDALPLPHRDGTGVLRAAPLPCCGVASTISIYEETTSLSLLIRWIQDQSHGAGKCLPFRSLGRELFPPRRRESIKSGPLALVGELPGGRDPAFGFQPMERRVQRTGLDLHQVFRGSLNMFGDCVAVGGSGQQSAKNKKVEGALQEFNARGRFLAHCVGILPLDCVDCLPKVLDRIWTALWRTLQRAAANFSSPSSPTITRPATAG